MGKFLKESALTVAAAAGFHLTPNTWKDRLCTLEGEFHRSSSEIRYRYGLAAVFIACAGLVTGLAIREYGIYHLDAQVYSITGLAIFLYSITIYYLSRTGIWYKFDHGVVAAFRAKGKLIWKEPLADLSSVVCTEGSGVKYITLLWKHRRRRMELYYSIKQALNAPAPDITNTK